MGTFVNRSIAVVVTFAALCASAEAQSPLEALGVPMLPTSNVPAGQVAVRFMGTSTILLDDGKTQLLIDGFFSRPNVFQLAFPIASNPGRVDRAMARAGIGKRLKAVLVAHSHYDHALDAPTIAGKTGARLVGSESTANIGRGAGLPDSQIDIVGHGQKLEYGLFQVTVFRSIHSPNMLAPGEIETPLKPRTHAKNYLEGGSYSFLITHRGFSILIHPSANSPLALYYDRERWRRIAHVVFLGAGGLGSQYPDFIRNYWFSVVYTTGASLVIPIHWDNFTRPLDDGLRLPERSFDDVPAGIAALQYHARIFNVRLRSMPLFDPVDIRRCQRFKDCEGD